MKRSMLVVLFVAFFATILSCGSGEKAGGETDPIERVENGLFLGAPVAGVDGASLEERMAALDVPAVSIAVIQDFEIVWAKAYGVADLSTGRMADTETLFQAASISKPVTATAVHQLVESGIPGSRRASQHLSGVVAIARERADSLDPGHAADASEPHGWDDSVRLPGL